MYSARKESQRAGSADKKLFTTQILLLLETICLAQSFLRSESLLIRFAGKRSKLAPRDR